MHDYLELCTEQQLRDMYADVQATEESLDRDVLYLMGWLDQHPYLPKVKDKQWLKHFLLRAGNSLEKTKKFLDVYYTARAEMPEVFENRDPCSEEMTQLRNFGSYIPVPKLTPDGYRVTIFHVPQAMKKETPSQEILLKGSQMPLDISLKVDKIRGLIIIFDLDNLSLSHVSVIFPVLKKMLSLQTEISPVNFHKIYIVNLLPLAEPLVTYGKNIVGRDIADRIEVWKKSAQDLCDVIPKKSLPQEYGGTEKSTEELAEQWYEYMKQFQDWFRSEEKVKTDLSKKPAGDKAEKAAYGVSGSFRKLTLD